MYVRAAASVARRGKTFGQFKSRFDYYRERCSACFAVMDFT